LSVLKSVLWSWYGLIKKHEGGYTTASMMIQAPISVT
jgi:hypothetical protein